MATEYLINDIKGSFDAEPVKAIVGQVWSGGDDALMEKRFGIIAGKPWNDSNLKHRDYES
jgi:hypothetical protein